MSVPVCSCFGTVTSHGLCRTRRTPTWQAVSLVSARAAPFVRFRRFQYGEHSTQYTQSTVPWGNAYDPFCRRWIICGRRLGPAFNRAGHTQIRRDFAAVEANYYYHVKLFASLSGPIPSSKTAAPLFVPALVCYRNVGAICVTMHSLRFAFIHLFFCLVAMETPPWRVCLVGDGVCSIEGLGQNAQVEGDFAVSADLDNFWAHWRYNLDDPGCEKQT